MLLYDHKHIIESSCGVQQGDPLGPLYFCCGIMALINEIQAEDPEYNKWYMDDGGIIASVEKLQRIWTLLKERGPALGLHLNPSKCEFSWLDPNCKLPCPIQLEGVAQEGQIKLVPYSEIQMLGVPLGSGEFVADFVEKKLLGRLGTTIDQLIDFEDSQSAFYLLRVSFSIVRAVHFMRTTPLELWKTEAVEFDSRVRSAAEQILGFPMSDSSYAQAALTPTLGGLGLRRTTEHALGAFAASWHESQRQSGEDWAKPAELPDYVPQKKASFLFDTARLKDLVDHACNDREAQRLMRVAQPHAGGFVTAVPSEDDGNDTVLRPRTFRTAIAYRLGVPVLNEKISCPMCMQTIDRLGDHATCCTKSGDLIVRHNSIRNLIDRVATDANLSPVMEKKGILGPTSGRRPGDVTIPIWSNGKGLAMDIAVTSPLTSSHVRIVSPCEEYAATQKHKKYDESFRGLPYFFSAVVFETTGAINEEGVGVLRQLFRFAAKRLGREFSSYCGRAWARLSCNLQRSVAQAILARIDGAPLPNVPLLAHLTREPVLDPRDSSKTIAHVHTPQEKESISEKKEVKTQTFTPNQDPGITREGGEGHATKGGVNTDLPVSPRKSTIPMESKVAKAVAKDDPRLTEKRPVFVPVPECKDCKGRPSACSTHDGIEFCDMQLVGGDPKCPDCSTGFIDCHKHMTFCREHAYSACQLCMRYKCSTHLDTVCCEEIAVRIIRVEQQRIEREEKDKQEKEGEGEKKKKAKEESQKRAKGREEGVVRDRIQTRRAQKRV
jgi:hypothetical protein